MNKVITACDARSVVHAWLKGNTNAYFAFYACVLDFILLTYRIIYSRYITSQDSGIILCDEQQSVPDLSWIQSVPE